MAKDENYRELLTCLSTTALAITEAVYVEAMRRRALWALR
jgi:hypothetical protein